MTMNVWEYLDEQARRREESRWDPRGPSLTAQQLVDNTRTKLAYMLVGAFVFFIPMFIFKMIPAENKDIITYMVGQLSGMALLALGLYFTNKAGQEALDAQNTDNNGKFADAIKEQAIATRNVLPETSADVTLHPGETARAVDAEGQ